MLSSKKITLNKLHFSPEHSVTFEMAERMQKVPYEIRNDEDVDIIVKWKSTRVRRFSTEPNYAIIKSKTKMKFKLAFKGLEDNNDPRDRFSAIISAIKNTDKDPKQIWKQYDLRKELLFGLRHKKFVFVVYEGVNEPNWWNVPINNDPVSDTRTFGVDTNEEGPEDPFMAALTAGNFRTVLIPLDQPTQNPPGNKSASNGPGNSA